MNVCQRVRSTLQFILLYFQREVVKCFVYACQDKSFSMILICYTIWLRSALIFSQNSKFCAFLYFPKVRFRFRVRFRIWQVIHGCSSGLIVTTLRGIEFWLALFINIRPSAVLSIFDALVKPIALYNCDLWIGYKSCYQKKSIEEMFEITFKGQNEFDKIFTRFSKFVLGVHSMHLILQY